MILAQINTSTTIFIVYINVLPQISGLMWNKVLKYKANVQIIYENNN